MPPFLRTLLLPLNLAAMLTWLAVALSMRGESADRHAAIATLMGTWLVLFLVHDLRVFETPGRRAAVMAAQAACALALCLLAPRTGTTPVLLVILCAQLAMLYPPRASIPVIVALHVALYLILLATRHQAPVVVTVVYAGFAAFAALTGHYARSAERTRDALAAVNADLLATRALLVDAARDAERLRVARDLHDVAGHKLTALMLNLRLLQADPQLAGRPELDTAQRMTHELLGDLRGVVQALRDSRGLDLATALRALAAPMPRPSLELEIDPQVRIVDPAVAEAVLRLVQEALTNAARHADAARLCVRVSRRDGGLSIRVEDDGRVRGPIREGSGLTGMRERIAALGGELALSRTAQGGLALDARLPA